MEKLIKMKDYPGVGNISFKIKFKQHWFKRKDVLSYGLGQVKIIKINKWNSTEKVLNKIKRKLGITKDGSYTVKPI